MQLIKNNPYRIIGILVGATAKEKERQLRRLRQFIEAEEEPKDDFSFPILGQLHRTIESVSDATSKLNLDSDKMHSALFWFYKFNEITDEPALDSLKDGDLQSATEIWTKLIVTGEVTQRNCSAFQNLSNLLLFSAFINSTINVNPLEKGISLKLKFLESDFVKDFKALATDETYKTSKKELQLTFLNNLQSEIDGNGGITSIKFLDIINRQEFSAKKEFLKSFVQKPIEQIEKKIEQAKSRRRTENADGAKAGKELYLHTIESISQLKTMDGSSNIKFSSISDKLANEILQCGIDYFKFNCDCSENTTTISKDHLKYFGVSSTENFAETTMDLFRKAKSLAFGKIALERCKENIEGLQEWIEETPVREKQKLISEDLQFITRMMIEIDSSSTDVHAAKKIVVLCKPELKKIKNVLENSDEFYLNISSLLVQKVQNLLIKLINKELYRPQRFNPLNLLEDPHTLFLKKLVIRTALETTFLLESLDMNDNLRKVYGKNLEDLKTISINFGVTTIHPREELRSLIMRNEREIEEKHKKVFLKREIDDIKLQQDKNSTAQYFHKEINNLLEQMKQVNKWKFFKNKSKLENQINALKKEIEHYEDLNNKEKIKCANNLNISLRALVEKNEIERKNSINTQKQEIANLQVLLDQYL